MSEAEGRGSGGGAERPDPGQGAARGQKPRPARSLSAIWAVLLVVLGVYFVQGVLQASRAREIRYGEFKLLVKAGKVTDAAIGTTAISGEMNLAGADSVLPQSRVDSLLAGGDTIRAFVTTRVDDPDLVRDLEAGRVPLKVER